MAGKLGGVKHKKGGPGINAEPNVIPFIDIMLVMLIIFMVAAPPPTVDIKVDLPPPNPIMTPPGIDKPTTVTLVDRGSYQLIYVETSAVTPETFKDTLLKVAIERNPTKAGDLNKLLIEAKIFVDADQGTAYDNVIGLINEIDQTGFKKVSLLVKSASG